VIGSFQKSVVNNDSSTQGIREIKVPQLLSNGMLNKDIAKPPGVTHETVKKHLKNIYQELCVQNRIEALQKVKLL
jgi:LuxR family maltose regulon positive regulatory protein